MEKSAPQWKLVIAGPLTSAYATTLQNEVEKERIPRVEFVGEVTGEEKARLFESSDLYVLPTHSENFGISVAEALAHGVPAIVYQGAPWRGLNDHGAGWWIAPDVETLAWTLRSATSLTDNERQVIGERAHSWVKSEFDWAEISRRTSEVYRWLCEPDLPQPEMVHCQ